MVLENLITIVLTLKDRHHFTHRWLKWTSSQNCKFKIIIADGSSDNYVEHLIKDNNFFNLNIEYVRYPYDATLIDWFKKLDSVFNLVTTEYCLQADNDDFILFNSLEDSLLDFCKNDKYNVYSRPQYRINFRNECNINEFQNLLFPEKDVFIRKINYHKEYENLRNNDPIKRLEFTILNFQSSLIWYGLHKTENLKRIHKKNYDNKCSLATVQEWYLYYSSPLFGEGCLIENKLPFVVRQEMTSQVAATLIQTERLDKIFLNPSWSRDIKNLINDLYYDICQKSEFIEFENFDSWFKQRFHAYLQSWNKFQYFADKYGNRKFYLVLKTAFCYIYKFKNSNLRYINIKKINDKELKKLEAFLFNS